MSAKFNYEQIQGVTGNKFVTASFVKAVEKMSARLKTKPEYVLAAISFETGGRFDPAIQNRIGATGLIQFLQATAKHLGMTTAALKALSAEDQLVYVEKYLAPYEGKLATLEAVYTAIIAGAPKKPDDVLFTRDRDGAAYKLNPLDWNNDGVITAREASAMVWARLFGGVEAVQQKLLDQGFVPVNLQNGFADGRWGTNTSAVVARFQKSKKLPATGLLDQATGDALFPKNDAKTSKAFVLKRGDDGDAVKTLQIFLIETNYLTAAEIVNDYGKFRAATEKAVAKLQKNLGFPATGKYDAAEQTAVKAILEGIKRGSAAVEIVKVLQNRLAALNYLTRAQINSGVGVFGSQTEAAVKKFQKEHLLPASGVIEKITFAALFNRSSSAAAEKFFVARNGEFFDAAEDILMTAELERKTAELAKIYFAEKHQKIAVTSGYRPPERQAAAIYNNILRKGELAVRRTYTKTAVIDQILGAFRANENNRVLAVEAMTAVIAAQVERGVYISKHLLANAIDIKTTADFKVLGRAAAQIGGRVITEGDHFHLEFA